jgi:TolB-like protein
MTTDSIESSRDAFISYASADAAVANSIVSVLEQSGVRCWIAPRDVVPGSLYADGIVRAINGTQHFVLVLSEHALASKHVGKEVERASSKGHPIFAIRTDEAPLTPAFEYFLSESQWIDLEERGPEAAAAKLLAAMHKQPPTTQQSPPVGGAVRPRRRRLVAPLAAGLTMVLLGALLVAFWPVSKSVPQSSVTTPSETKAQSIAEKSIAVLPFTDMSEKHDQEYLADGMAEEILNLLAQAPELLVSARTSSFYFKGKQTKIPDIARELGVAHVLEGSIRRSGDHLRVTAQLVRADNGYHLWSETYDRELRDVFKVQDDIANAVVQALQIKLMGGELSRQKGGTQNLEAYLLFLRALRAVGQPTKSSLDAAAEYLDQAIKLDPSFGWASALLADAVMPKPLFGLLDPAEGYERGRQLAQHALQLSPDLAEPHAVYLFVHLKWDWDWGAAETEMERALAIDPTNMSALHGAGILFSTLGRWDDAERQLRLALVRDPLDAYGIFNLGEAYYRAGRYAESEAMLRKLLELAPGFGYARSQLGKTLLAAGKPDAALAMVQQEAETFGRYLLPIVLQANDRKAEADDALQGFIAQCAADRCAYGIALNYAYRGDRDLALQWLERAYEQKDGGLTGILGEHLFKNVADDPRYKAFLRKMKLPELADLGNASG